MNDLKKLIVPGAKSQTRAGRKYFIWAALAFCFADFSGSAFAADVPVSGILGGEKTAWHGFDRYDFLMDEQTLAIKPIKAQDDEMDGIKHQIKGQRRCIVVVPKTVAAGNPWSWRGCYWNHQPQAEVELLKRGFHIAYIESSATLQPGRQWDAWYDFLTDKLGLSRKPAFVGMSKGGEFAYMWAADHPDKVSCIYADNPGGHPNLLMKMGPLATNDVPLLNVCGSIDPTLGRTSLALENIYREFGGRITMMIKEGRGHHPHSLRDPQPIADWMEQNIKPASLTPPAFGGAKLIKTYYYSSATSYRNFPKEGIYIACRGPGFVDCYDRFAFEIEGVQGEINVIVPKRPAPGMPWVYRADYVRRDAAVDLVLLAKGFHIVSGPLPYADGPVMASWNAVYKHLTNHGFSKKPAMEGEGAAAGEEYAWAIENPDKVSCIYAENPVMHSVMAKMQPIDNLAPLARARVPLLDICGSLDPWLADNTMVVKKTYKKLGGRITVIINQGAGHFPLDTTDAKPVVDFITRRAN